MLEFTSGGDRRKSVQIGTLVKSPYAFLEAMEHN